MSLNLWSLEIITQTSRIIEGGGSDRTSIKVTKSDGVGRLSMGDVPLCMAMHIPVVN